MDLSKSSVVVVSSAGEGSLMDFRPWGVMEGGVPAAAKAGLMDFCRRAIRAVVCVAVSGV